MQVITTHISADFDCVAAMVAAGKLYPEAKMVFSGSLERSVQEYFKETHSLFDFTRAREIDLDQVTLLVLVDTHEPGRIGEFQALVGKPGVEIHVYDHHVNAADKIHPARSVIRNRGASTTVLFEILSEKNISLSREECTLMVLGIYQDTHSLNSVSTTPEDFQAVAHLVRMGANLSVVSHFVQPRLIQEQVDVLNDLIRNLEIHNFNGVEVAVATASVDRFVDDLAIVVHKVMELENLLALVVLVRLDRRLYLIARSRTEGIDVSEVAQPFGGGGHAVAASASVQEMTLVQAKEKLLQILKEKARPLYRVEEIMHFPVIAVQEKDAIQSVEKKLTHFNLNTLPVLTGEKPVGLITRQIVEKAIHHKLKKERVEDLMIREFSVTFPETNFKTIVPVIIEEKQKLVPVVHPKTGQLVGIVSRGDLLRVLYGDMIRQGRKYAPLFDGKVGFHKNVKSLMKERLPKKVMEELVVIAQTADQEGVSVYAVGGFVRDLLLDTPNLDVDVVVEGDGIQFAKVLGKKLKGKVKTHIKYGTSVIFLPDGMKIDVATARMEFYKHPAALPTVERSSIKSDLFRRDFTFNSLAVKLNGKDAFCLIDYFNGERDLKDKVVRVLHNLSFIEDPTRVLRAIRFEQRLGFHIGKQTEAFMKSAIQKRLLDELSGTRLLNELKIILKEEKPMQCIRRMKAFNVLQFISPNMLRNKENLEVMDRIQEVLSWAKIVPLTKEPEVWFIYFLGLFYFLDEASFHKAVERLQVPSRLKKRLATDREQCRKSLGVLKGGRELTPSQVYDVFSGLSLEGALFLLALAADDQVNKYASLYFTQYLASARLSLTGDDLIRMGIKPGPVFQSVFKTLREARVNGRVKTREEEMALVTQQFLKP